MKAIQKYLLAFVFFCLPQAFATNLTFGAQGGSGNPAKSSFESSLGYGVFLQASALDILTLQADYFSAQKNTLHKKTLSSDLLFHLLNFDRLKIGLLAGPGFYQNKNDRWRFGLNGGAFGEFSLFSRIPLGLQARYHSAFSGENNDLLSIFITLGFRFGSGSDW
jgi:hypothetical protein